MEDRSEIIRARIEPSLKHAFEKVCAAQDRTSSQIMRDMIRDYVKQHAQADLLGAPKRGRK